MSVQIENLIKTFHQNQIPIPVLKGLSAQIQDGEIVAIIGESGAGKSTLLSILAGLDDADSGKLVIDGVDLLSLSEKQKTVFRGQHIGIVFQQYHLIPHLNVLENVVLPLEIQGASAGQEKALSLLNELGLSQRSSHFPRQLSGGEAQRVAIARALITEPKFLLADEPSGSLDSETGQKVMNKFFEVVRKHKTTTILVTHNPELAQKCDRTLKIANGILSV